MADYCTTAQVKAFTNIVYTDYDKDMASADFDTLIGALITEVTARINAYCNRDFDNHATQTDTYSVGPNDRRVLTVNGPIITLTTVKTRGDKSGTFATLDSDYYTYVHPGVNNPAVRADVALLIKTGFGITEMNILSRRWVPSYRSAMGKRQRATWLRGYENVQVASTYGFSSVPESIKRVCIRMVDIILNERVRTSSELVSDYESPDIKGAIPSQGFPPDIRAELDLWKSVKSLGGVI